MLLRSITKHVKDQNWFAVFLDFFIVVAGILIAFQITNWNEARADRRAESGYLISMEQDMEDSITEIDEVTAQLKSQEDARKILFAYSRGETAQLDQEALPELIYRALWSYSPVQFRERTFETLTNSGQLSALGDKKLLNALQELSALIDEANNEEGLEQHVLESFSDPLLFENFDMAPVMMATGLDSGNVLVPWLTSGTATYEVPEVMKTEQFRNAVVFRSSSANERIGTLERIRMQCIEIRTIIDARQAKIGAR